MEYDKIYLWSNGSIHSNLEEYGRVIYNPANDENSINVFLNACVPLQANKNKFLDGTNISIHCGVAEKNERSGILGFNEIQQFGTILRDSYVIDGAIYFWKLPKDTSSYQNYKEYLKVGTFICQIDQTKFIDGCPKDKPWGCTTGFRTYFLLKQLYPNSKIVLVNFGVKDDKFQVSNKFHTIEYEDKYFNEHKVERLTI